MKEKTLIQTAKELQETLVLEPELDITLKPDELTAQVQEAATFLKADDEVSKETITALRELFPDSSELKKDVIKTFEVLGILDEEEPGEEKTEDPEDKDNLFTEVDNAEQMKDLKEIAKANDEFKKIRGELSKYKSTNQLRDAMLDVLEAEPKEIEPEPVPKEKAKSEAKKPVERKTQSTSEKKEKKESKATPVKSERTRAQIFAEIFQENTPRTMNELVDEMMKRYHSDSITGAKTFVPIYVSILKEIGLFEKNEKNQYVKSA